MPDLGAGGRFECDAAWVLRNYEATRPALGSSSGIFNGYGRIYLDSGHIEMAACECDSPYTLALVIERQQRLVAQTVARLAERGQRLLITNNNHSGVLSANCPVWVRMRTI